MQQSMIQKIQIYAARNKYRRIFRKFVQILACVVVFCTTYALILPAITMEQNVFCGLEEHVHDVECYQSDNRLICTEPAVEGHIHNESCYTLPAEREHVHTDVCEGQVQGDLICTIPEAPGHVHGDSCYTVSDILECSLPTDHVHGDNCRSYPLVCTLSTDPHVHSDSCLARGDLICGLEAGHIHDSECREQVLSCNNLEEGHEHTDDCYTTKTVCSIPENHSHEASCYEFDIVCGIDEGYAHTHDDACYGSETELTCTLPELHIHNNSCYKLELTCTTEESPGHSHDDSCYQMISGYVCGKEAGEMEQPEPELICTEPAVEGHVHVDSCYEAVEPICGSTDPEHIHTEQCWSLICGLEAHSHTLACYSDPEADLETQEIWEATFAEVELTGKWNEDVLAIAETQLGYAESSRNYAVWENNTTHGYTRYGAWYGSPYGDWCAMFTSFCLHYAEVEGMPLHWGVRPWIEELTELKLYHEAEVYEPKPGDIIFYDWEGDGLSDHVGIVAEIIVHEENENQDAKEKLSGQVKAIEGNSSNLVQYVYYDIDDERILGYSELPDNPEVYSCGILRHSHNEYCYDYEGNFICHQLEHEHTDACEPRDEVYCGYEEHSHIASCYDPEGNLICGCEEHIHNVSCTMEAAPEEPAVYYCGLEEHTHGELCCNEAGMLICEIPEHTHTEECSVEPIIRYCGLEEHTHIEACYDETGELVCVIPEHTHAEECSVEPVTYYCSLEEHTHIEACYDETGELICVIPEHIHTEECSVEPITYYCGLEEHTHIETCYNEAGELVCEIPEHIHIKECSIEPIVIYYCGLEDHTHGETCYNEADEMICEIAEHVHTDACLVQPVWLCGKLEHSHGETCYNEAGELTCETAEHIHTEECTIPGGYVCGLEEHTHDENCYDAEGNFICLLSEHTHSDACKAQNFYACGLTEHTHTETCYDESGNLICQIPTHIHTSACVGRNLYYSDMQIRVHAVIRGVENLPEKLTLKVKPVVQEENPESFGSMQVALSEQISNREQYLSTASFFDMYLLSEDQVYDLPETAIVTVTMEFEQPIFTAEDVADSVSTQAFMITPEGGVQYTPEEVPEDASPAEETPAEESNLLESVVSAIGDGLNSILTPAHALEDLPDTITEGENPGTDIPEDSGSDEEDIPAVNPDAENTGSSDESEPVVPSGPVYEISSITGEDYGNPSQGITSVTFQTNRISTFAVTLASTMQQGTFWERVYSTNDITSDGTYMIISAEGNYALTGNSNKNYQAVTLQTVKGNTRYYTISGSDDTNLRWTFNGSNNSYTIKNQGTSNYVYLAHVRTGSSGFPFFQPVYSDYVLDSATHTVTLSYAALEKCWRINNGEYYLRHVGGSDSGFAITNENDGSYDDYDQDYNADLYFYFTRDMLIFKLSDTTSLHVPEDVNESVSDDTGQEIAPDKPNYGEFTSVTGVIYERDTAVTDADNPSSTVPGKAYSDPSTSDIEKHFRKSSFADSQVIDGLVKTDKSVIYGMDDYGAFDDYRPNTFGVTLSALGQEYAVPYEETYTAPIDVVFVLDASGSMATKTESGQDADGRDPNRATSVKNAVNSSIAEIMQQDDANRVGIALYSSGAWQMLPLDRYTATNGEYLVCEEKTVNFAQSGLSKTVNIVKGGPTLKNEAGVSFAGAGDFNDGDANPVYQGLGTYTQAGIAQGYSIFQGIDGDVTYTTDSGKILKRQPVFVLLSDGEPTHSTNNFMDVFNGPIYGDGGGDTSNALAIHGYNTILSANYYKRMVGIQYNKPAMFYTIGMGIHTPEAGDGPMVSGSDTGDTYKRAVLDPGNIGDYNVDDNNNANTIVKLLQMLGNRFNDQSMTVSPDWPDGWTGIPHKNAPVLQENPYADDYSYANKSYFGALPTEELEKIFSEILTETLKGVEYGFILYENSSVTVEDHIGDGMEVKGLPVLIYGNQTYRNPTVSTVGNITTYVYTGIYEDPYIPDHSIDISKISITITENADGTQTVEMFVPDVLLPTYSPEMIGQQFYYEQLPVRLIYQVGLTPESEAEVLALQRTGGSLTFYTNKWGGEDHARSDLTPSLNNPFYHDTDGDGPNQKQYSEHCVYKGGFETLHPNQNSTDTEPYAVDCHDEFRTIDGESVYHVYHELGNNGKLVFEAAAVDIPVEKKWEETYGVLELPEISLTLYRVTPDGSNPDQIQQVEEVQSIILNGTTETPWSGTFASVPAPTEDWYYAIAEKDIPDGYQVSYEGNTISISPDNGKPITAVKVTFTEGTAELVTVTNTFTQWYELPKTGGAGTIPYTAGGLLLTTVALLLLYNNFIKRRKEDLISS